MEALGGAAGGRSCSPSSPPFSHRQRKSGCKIHTAQSLTIDCQVGLNRSHLENAFCSRTKGALLFFLRDVGSDVTVGTVGQGTEEVSQDQKLPVSQLKRKQGLRDCPGHASPNICLDQEFIFKLVCCTARAQAVSFTASARFWATFSGL